MKAGLKFADRRDHRQPQLRARDRHARVRLRPGRRDPRARGRCQRHPQRHRRPGVESGARQRHRRCLRHRAPAGQAGLPPRLAGRTGPAARRQRPAADRGQPAHRARKAWTCWWPPCPSCWRRACRWRCRARASPCWKRPSAWPSRRIAGRVHVHIGYDEARAHRLIAGADVIAVPSRFEPCGLTQMYGLRYGTLPIVRRVGGLADTVSEGAGAAAADANGFVFDAATPAALASAMRWQRAVELRREPAGCVAGAHAARHVAIPGLGRPGAAVPAVVRRRPAAPARCDRGLIGAWPAAQAAGMSSLATTRLRSAALGGVQPAVGDAKQFTFVA